MIPWVIAYSVLHQEWMGHRFRTQLLTPIKEVTIETGQRVGLTLKQREVSGNQSQSARSFILYDSDCSDDECLIFMIINKMSSDRRRRDMNRLHCSDGEIRCKLLTETHPFKQRLKTFAAQMTDTWSAMSALNAVCGLIPISHLPQASSIIPYAINGHNLAWQLI